MTSAAGAAEELRFVRFEDPQAFLEATKEFDNSFMSLCIGSLCDYLNSPQHTAQSAGDSSKLAVLPVHLLAIYRGNDLLITLTHTSTDFAWLMCVPAPAESLLTGTPTTPGLLAPAISLLATSTLSQLSPDPLALDKLLGPSAAVQAFTTTWSAHLTALGLPAHVSPGDFSSHISYATRTTLPSPSPSPGPYTVAQATAADLDAVAQLHIGYEADTLWHRTITRAAALAFVERPVRAGLVWLVRVDVDDGDGNGEPVGYLVLGRATPRTIAIRNAFVARQHRRKGVAAAMVQGVTRYYLDARPYAVVADGQPVGGFKEEVNLNVAVADAERVYRRAGFLLPDVDADGESERGGVDPGTGRKGWYRAWLSVWRGPEPPAEAQS